MATIIPIIKNGKVQSYKIRTYLGRDELGKQIVKYTHWYIPEGVSESKAKKMVKKEAKAWEKEQQSGITREKRKKICSGGGTMPLSVFIKEKWLPLFPYLSEINGYPFVFSPQGCGLFLFLNGTGSNGAGVNDAPAGRQSRSCQKGSLSSPNRRMRDIAHFSKCVFLFPALHG